MLNLDVDVDAQCQNQYDEQVIVTLAHIEFFKALIVIFDECDNVMYSCTAAT